MSKTRYSELHFVFFFVHINQKSTCQVHVVSDSVLHGTMNFSVIYNQSYALGHQLFGLMGDVFYITNRSVIL